MNAIPHPNSLSPANDDSICTNILEQISRVSRAQIDAEKCSVYSPGSDYERCWEAVETEKVELRRQLINAGFSRPDWEAFEGAFR